MNVDVLFLSVKGKNIVSIGNKTQPNVSIFFFFFGWGWRWGGDLWLQGDFDFCVVGAHSLIPVEMQGWSQPDTKMFRNLVNAMEN